MMELSAELFQQLYSAMPEEFLSVRSALVQDAKHAGDADLARRITAQRKPTLAAWIVNGQVHAEPGWVERLLDLGARLRVAHDDLDAGALRDLSAERRHLVSELTTAALTRADRRDPPVALRDDVTATFDAAIADPQIAARLGRLTRPERWSGFGVAADDATGPPELTVIRGGRARSTSAPAVPRAPAKRADPAARTDPAAKADPAARRRARRARDKAHDAFAAVEAEVAAGEDAERSAATRIHDLGGQLTRIQAELADTKQDLEQVRREVRSARNRRRAARSTLDRAERQLERNGD